MSGNVIDLKIKVMRIQWPNGLNGVFENCVHSAYNRHIRMSLSKCQSDISWQSNVCVFEMTSVMYFNLIVIMSIWCCWTKLCLFISLRKRGNWNEVVDDHWIGEESFAERPYMTDTWQIYHRRDIWKWAFCSNFSKRYCRQVIKIVGVVCQWSEAV